MKINTAALVKKEQLLELLFPLPESRPSIRWLNKMMNRRVIPYYKLGHGVWFDVDQVRESLMRKNYVRAL